MLAYVIIVVAAYLLGSIPTGYLVARAKGIDIRTVGSGNIGATNAMRVLGKPAGISVLLVDALKGFAACRLGLPGIVEAVRRAGRRTWKRCAFWPALRRCSATITPAG